MRPPNIPFTPGARPRSTRRVEKPLRARVSAAAEPAGPAPTTMTSKRSTLSRSHCGKARRVKGFPPAHAIGIGCSSNSHRSWPCAIQEISSHRSSFATSRRPIPAIQPARKWQTGFFEGPYALAIGLLCLATLNRPRSGSKWMISVRPHPVSADASIIRFAPSMVSGVETPARQRPEEFQPGIRAPLAGQIQDPFRRSTDGLFELLLDAHDDLGPEDETRLIREAEDPGLRIGMEGRREEFAGFFRTHSRQVHLRTNRRGLAIAGGHRSYPCVLRQRAIGRPPMRANSYRKFPPESLP